jgi:hypothetical protein
MSLTDDERRAVVIFRLEKGQNTLAEAKGIAQMGYWTAVANRLDNSLSAFFYRNNIRVV